MGIFFEKRLQAILLGAALLPTIACTNAAETRACSVVDPECNFLAASILYEQTEDPWLLMAGGSLDSTTAAILVTSDGINWDTRATPPGAASISSITRVGSRLIAAGGTSGPSCYIATSDDNGFTWIQRDCGTTGVALSGVRAGNGIVYAVGPDDGGTPPVRISSDNGETWQDPANGTAGTDLNFLEFFNGTFYAGSGGGSSGLFATPDPANVPVFAVQPTAGAYFYPRVLGNRLFTVNNTAPGSLHALDTSGNWQSWNVFANRPVDEISYSMAIGDKILVLGGGFTTGTSSCYVDYSTDGVNFNGGGIMANSCSAVPGEAFLVFRAIHYRGLYIATGLDAIGGTNKNLRGYSASGLPGEWTVETGTSVPFMGDFIAVVE